MTERSNAPQPVPQAEEEFSFLAVGTVLLRHRRLIVALAILGAAVGMATGLLATRMYMANAVFIPQGSQEGASGLALVASQFGIRLPTSSSAWGPAVYVELLRSRTLLESLALDSIQ